MTVKECYQEMGADYEEAVGRLMSERLVTKFALKFLNEPSFEALRSALAAENWEEAFRAAHTLKGVCLNLAFARLSRSVEAITEPLRPGHEDLRAASDIPALFAAVEADYQVTVEALSQLQ